jgi:hypothetical protein
VRAPRRAPEVEPGRATPCQVVRTIPRRTYHCAPQGEFSIAHAYLAAIAWANRFISPESRYLWSAELVGTLTAVQGPEDLGKYDTDQHVAALHEADRGAGRSAAYALDTGGPASGLHGFHYCPIEVHATVAIVDDAWYAASSANPTVAA